MKAHLLAFATHHPWISLGILVAIVLFARRHPFLAIGLAVIALLVVGYAQWGSLAAHITLIALLVWAFGGLVRAGRGRGQR